MRDFRGWLPDSIVMTSENTSAIALKGIPNVAVKVIVASEKEAARLGEGDWGDSTDDWFMTKKKNFIRKWSIYNKPVDKKFLVGADIEKAASSIIRAGSERLVVGEVSNSVDIRLVASEGLDAAASSDIPEFRGGITAARDKGETIVAKRKRCKLEEKIVHVLILY